MNKNKIVPRENGNQTLVDDVRRTDVNKCRTCLKDKPLEMFYNIKKNPDCKVCRNEKDRENYKKNSIKYIERTKAFRKANPKKMKEQHLKTLYKISLNEYNQKFIEQNGVCEICGEPEKFSKRYGKQINLSVDHNHKTNIIQGLLCSRCNITLGRINEDASILSNMINYINKYQKLR